VAVFSTLSRVKTQDPVGGVAVYFPGGPFQCSRWLVQDSILQVYSRPGIIINQRNATSIIRPHNA
jgi:hypothetical protein